MTLARLFALLVNHAYKTSQLLHNMIKEIRKTGNLGVCRKGDSLWTIDRHIYHISDGATVS